MATKNSSADIKDSAKDAKKLQPDEVILELPEVKDIPGQENVKVPDMREMADTTISSDDEEGVGIFEDENGDDASTERTGPAIILNEDKLMIDDEDMEAELDSEEDENNLDNDNIEILGNDNVTPMEKRLLQKSTDYMNNEEDENLNNALLNDTDDDGDELNEISDLSGNDLDVPGAEEDDEDEAIGEEDEENNDYSLGDNR